MTVKSKFSGVPLPKVANQGGMGSSKATTQPTKIQPKSGSNKPGASTILFTKQPTGTKGTNKGAK